MMHQEQSRIIDNWSYHFQAVQLANGHWYGRIDYSDVGMGALADRTRPCSLWHNMVDEAYNMLSIHTRMLVDKIEREKCQATR